MAKVVFNTSMSLDGFVAGPNDDVEQVFAWYHKGDTEFRLPGSPFTSKITQESAELLGEISKTIGALVTGRRTFDLAGAWGGNPPLGVPTMVLTHRVPQEWVKEGSPFTFVTDGIESAVAKAKEAAGGKDVAIATASGMRQCIQAGLLDEIHIDLAPVLLGAGVPLFENPGMGHVELEPIRVVETPHVTHLKYRVVK